MKLVYHYITIPSEVSMTADKGSIRYFVTDLLVDLCCSLVAALIGRWGGAWGLVILSAYEHESMHFLTQRRVNHLITPV